jgi:hypothetical protein
MTVATIFDLLNKARPLTKEIEQPRKNADLRAFLLDILMDGPVPTTLVIERAMARGFTKKQITYARVKMKIAALKETKRWGRWMWVLMPPARPVYPTSDGTTNDAQNINSGR